VILAGIVGWAIVGVDIAELVSAPFVELMSESGAAALG